MADDTFTGADFAPADSGTPAAGEGGTVATPEPIAVTPGAATTEPATGQVEPRSTEGPIPFQAHKTALDNARAKAAEEAWKGYESLRGVPPDQVQELLHWWQRAQADTDGFLLQTMQEHTDPVALLEKLVQQVQAHPQHGQRLASLAAKQLAAQRGQVEPQPDRQIQLEDGSIVAVFSPEMQAKRDAWLQQRTLSKLREEFAPITKTVEQFQAEQQAAAQERQIEQFKTTTMQDVQTWPGMDSPEHRKLVAEKLAQMPVNGDDPRDVTLALNAAYRSVILPRLGQTERSKVLQTIQQQAAAGSVNPGQTSTHAPKTMAEMSIAEALQHVAAQQG